MSLDQICARNLMTSKTVTALREESLRTAVTRMTEHAIHGLLIAPDAPHLGYSILTGKDCIEILCDGGEAAFDELCVEDVMKQPTLTIPAGLCVSDCIRLMRHAGVRTGPVLDEGELVDVLTFTDVLRACC